MTPTIGRVVYYQIPDNLFEGDWSSKYGQSQMIAAIITGVWPDDDDVNLTVFPDGAYAPFSVTNVPFYSSQREKYGHFWDWPLRT